MLCIPERLISLLLHSMHQFPKKRQRKENSEIIDWRLITHAPRIQVKSIQELVLGKRASVSRRGRGSVPMAQHLLKGFIPLVGEASCKLLCFLGFRCMTSPHIWLRCLRSCVGFDHCTKMNVSSNIMRAVFQTYSSCILINTSQA